MRNQECQSYCNELHPESVLLSDTYILSIKQGVFKVLILFSLPPLFVTVLRACAITIQTYRTKQYGVDIFQLYMQKLEFFPNNKMHRIFREFEIQTGHPALVFSLVSWGCWLYRLHFFGRGKTHQWVSCLWH